MNYKVIFCNPLNHHYKENIKLFLIIIIKKIIKKLYNKIHLLRSMEYWTSIQVMFIKDLILVNWSESSEKNFGDDLNPWMLHKMTGKTIINSRKIFNIKRLTEFSFIGSIVGNYKGRKMVIMGSGIMSKDRFLEYSSDSTFLFVRGPLTREKILENGYDCPEIFGDAALLLPLLYKPSAKRKFKLGVIPHYVDKNHTFIDVITNCKECLIIDIQGGIEKVIDSINSCELIVSSSLHGLIAADAYGIPSRWVRLSSKVKGEGFKFRDYFLSVGRKKMTPYQIHSESSYEDLIRLFEIKEDINIDLYPMLEKLPIEFKIFLNT